MIYLMGHIVEDRSHLPHVVDIESWVEHLSLLLVGLTCTIKAGSVRRDEVKAYIMRIPSTDSSPGPKKIRSILHFY